MNSSTLILFSLACLDHLGQDLRCCYIVVALQLNAVKLLLELANAFLLLLRLYQGQLLLIVLPLDVCLLAPPLAPYFE